MGRVLPGHVICNRMGICHHNPAWRTDAVQTLINLLWLWGASSAWCPCSSLDLLWEPSWYFKGCMIVSAMKYASTWLQRTPVLDSFIDKFVNKAIFLFVPTSRVLWAARAAGGQPARPARWRGTPCLPSHSYLSSFWRWIIYQRCFFGQ